MPKILNGPILIVGEGVEDEAFFSKLIAAHNLQGFQIGCVGGKDKFASFLGGLKVTTNFDKLFCIVIVIDNDNNPSKAFDGLRDQIIDAEGYPVPARPLEPVTGEGFPALVVIPLPWMDEAGCLETLCLISASQQNVEIWNCLERYKQCVDVNGEMPQKDKMLMRCLLATACKTDPNTGLRYAWSRPENMIPLTNTCFERLVAFLRNLSTRYSRAL